MESHKGLFNLEIQAASSVHTQVRPSCAQHQNRRTAFCSPVQTAALQLLIGQPPGALPHTLPCPGGGSDVPVARERGEDPREQAGARAEAEHHLLVLGQLRAAGPLPASGAG